MTTPTGDAEGIDQEQPSSRKAVYIGLLFEGGLILLAWLLGWLLTQPPLATVKLNLSGFGLGIAATLPLLLGLALVVGLPAPGFKQLLRVFDEWGRPFFASYSVFHLALISLVAGVGEELLFRGVLQAALDRWAGTWVALPVASLLFGALHALTPTYAVLATCAGLYLGGVWLLTDNLLVAIIAHGLYDFIALVYLLRVRIIRALRLRFRLGKQGH